MGTGGRRGHVSGGAVIILAHFTIAFPGGATSFGGNATLLVESASTEPRATPINQVAWQ